MLTDGQSVTLVGPIGGAWKEGTMAQAQIAIEVRRPAPSRVAMAVARYRTRRLERRAVRRLLQQRADGLGTGARI